jgi:deoxycytidylate deaminase
LLRVSHQDCDGATLYVTGLPCWECSKLIVGSGVRRVVYLAGRRPVDLETVLGLHASCGVDLVAVDSAEIDDLAA